MRRREERGSVSVWALFIIAGAFTMLLGLVVDGGNVLDDRTAAARAAGQAARLGADSLSSASVRNGHDAINVEAARAKAQGYLHDAGLNGVVRVSGRSVTVTVTGRSSTQILGVVGIDSFPISETRTAQAITEEDLP